MVFKCLKLCTKLEEQMRAERRVGAERNGVPDADVQS